jgi:putative salt-induced outer membrane protein YdiY
MNTKLTLAALCLLPLSTQFAMAEEASEESAYTMSAELGFLFKSGNTKSGDIKAGFNLKHEKDQWLSLFSVNAIAKKLEEENAAGEKEFNTTDNKWDIAAQTNYSLEADGKNYLYGSVAYQQDKFSGFVSQSSLSAGWGRKWHETKTTSFFADIGPGVTHDVHRTEGVNGTPEYVAENSDTNAIIQAQALYTNKINDFVEFKQYLVAKQALESGKNSIYKSETSLTTKLIDSLQFKFALRVDYDTEVAAEYENTNTETSVTLVYSF